MNLKHCTFSTQRQSFTNLLGLLANQQMSEMSLALIPWGGTTHNLVTWLQTKNAKDRSLRSFIVVCDNNLNNLKLLGRVHVENHWA